MIVLDSVGIGGAPDALAYGDQGANTLGHLMDRRSDLRIPVLKGLGIDQLLGQAEATPSEYFRHAFRLSEESEGKDTTVGHWELMGVVTAKGFETFKHFPEPLVRDLEAHLGVSFIGNYRASGTEILKHLGDEHRKTGKPILYTSSDSVLQIAAHEEDFDLRSLLDLCKNTREFLDQRQIRIGRVIARPFVGSDSASYVRTGNRHDYSLKPPSTSLERLKRGGVWVTGVGKISDIFAGEGLSESLPTGGNSDGMRVLDRLVAEPSKRRHFIFANLVDFDSLYGHRRDPAGYAKCLNEFDDWLGNFLGKLRGDDVLIVTADHGNDPFADGTDHTREQVPCLVAARESLDIPEMKVFSDVGRFVETLLLTD